MRIFWSIVIGAFALVTLSFLVPEFESSPTTSLERLVEIRLDESGERLLLRMQEHDYEFALPPNRLGEALAPSSERRFYFRNDDSGVGIFNRLRVDSSGTALVNFEARFGGYQRQSSEPQTVLSDELRKHLSELGFAPSNGNSVGDIEPAPYMVWNRDLVGRQSPALSRGSYTGIAIHNWCYDDGGCLRVTESNPAKQQRNRSLNFMLAPLHAIRDGVRYILTLPVILILILSGFRPGA